MRSTGPTCRRCHVQCAYFEQTARLIDRQYSQSAFDLIERDGYTVLENGRITGRPAVVRRDGALSKLTDAGTIREHLDRISGAIESDDAAQAIGSAKELIESTAKLVLRDLDRQAEDAWDLPKLVLEAQLALRVHPTTASPGPDGSDGVKRILGALTTVATGVAELRNRGFGTAHLAVGTARAWCEFMLDTLGDPQAPWRKEPRNAVH
jgi:hypothetical protein